MSSISVNDYINSSGIIRDQYEYRAIQEFMKHLLLFIVILCGLPLSAKDVVVHLTDSKNAPLSYLMVSTTNQSLDELNTYYYADRDGYITLPLTEPGAPVSLYLRQLRRPKKLGSTTWDGMADTLEIKAAQPYTAILLPSSDPDFINLFRLEVNQLNIYNSISFSAEIGNIYRKYESDPYNCYYSNELKGVVTYIWNCTQDTLSPSMENNSLIDWGDQTYNPEPIVRDTIRNLFEVNITDELSFVKLSLLDFDKNLISNWSINQNPVGTTYYHGFRHNTNMELDINIENSPIQFTYDLLTDNQPTFERVIDIKDYYNRLKIILRDRENNLLNGWICNGDTATNSALTFFSPINFKNYNLSFSQDHYLPWERNCIITGSDEVYEYDLKESYPVTLKFIDSYGIPMANQTFTAYTGEHSNEIHTDATGTCSFNLNEPVYLIEDITYNDTLSSNKIVIESVSGNSIYKEVMMQRNQNSPQNQFHFKYKSDYTGSDYKGLAVNCDITLYEEQPNGFIKPFTTFQGYEEPLYSPEYFLKDRKYWVVFHNQSVYKYGDYYNTEFISDNIAPRMIPLDISHMETVDGKNYVYLSNLLEDYRILSVSRDTSTFATFEMDLSLPGPLEHVIYNKFYGLDTIYVAPNTYKLNALNLLTKNLVKYPVDIPDPTFTVLKDMILDCSGVEAEKETADLNICIKNELGEPIKGMEAYYNTTIIERSSLTAVTNEDGMVSFKKQRPGSVTVYFMADGTENMIPYTVHLNPGVNNHEFTVHGLFNTEIEFTGTNSKSIQLFNMEGRRIMTPEEVIFKDSIHFSYYYMDDETNTQYLGTVHSDRKEKITLNLDEIPYNKILVDLYSVDVSIEESDKNMFFMNGSKLCLAPGTYYFDESLKATINEEDNFKTMSELFEQKFRKINYPDDRYYSIYIDGKYYAQYCDLPPGVYNYTFSEANVSGTLEIREEEKEIDVYAPELYDIYLYYIDQNGNLVYDNNIRYHLEITNLENGKVGSLWKKDLHFTFPKGTYLLYPISDKFRAHPIKITVDGRQNTWAIPVETGSYFSATIRVTDSDGQPIPGASVSLNGGNTLFTSEYGMVQHGGFPCTIGEAELTVSAAGFDTRIDKISLEELYFSSYFNVVLEKTSSIEDQTVEQGMTIHLQSNGFTVNSNQNELIKYELYDLQGRKVTEGKTLPANPIRLGALNRGVYIIRCTQGANHAAVKFVNNN